MSNHIYMLIKHPDGLTHIERNGCTIGYAFNLSSGLSGCLFNGAESKTGVSKRGLLAWVKQNDKKVVRHE